MSSTIPSGAGDYLSPPKRLFPLVRHLSYPATLALYRLPVTPNQITAASLVLGLLAAWMFSYTANHLVTLLAALFFTAGYVLDNCDGEIARLKDLASDFGKRFDTFVDWIVHGAFFIALGFGISAQTGQNFWLWFGIAAAIGGTINYVIDTLRDSGINISGDREGFVEDGPDTSKSDQSLYASRVIRTDFCFIVLALSLFDSLWLLLPTGAIGAQAYWMLQFIKGFRRHHV